MLTAAQAHGARNQPVLCGGRRIIYVLDSSQMDVDAIGLFR
jgi:hypothetical protein